MTSKWPRGAVPSSRGPDNPSGSALRPCPAREAAQAKPPSGDRSRRDTSTGASSSASTSSTRERLPKCSAAAATASVRPTPPQALVQTLRNPRLPRDAGGPCVGHAGRPGGFGSRLATCVNKPRSSAGAVDAARTWSTPRPARYARPIPAAWSNSPTHGLSLLSVRDVRNRQDAHDVVHDQHIDLGQRAFQAGPVHHDLDRDTLAVVANIGPEGCAPGCSCRRQPDRECHAYRPFSGPGSTLGAA